jgi:hypothetical protein
VRGGKESEELRLSIRVSGAPVTRVLSCPYSYTGAIILLPPRTAKKKKERKKEKKRKKKRAEKKRAEKGAEKESEMGREKRGQILDSPSSDYPREAGAFGVLMGFPMQKKPVPY